MALSRKFIITFFVVAIFILFFVLDLSAYFSLAQVKNYLVDFDNFYQKYPSITIALFLFIFISLNTLFLPIAPSLTIICGAIFGFVKGLIIASFAASFAAVGAFLLARYLYGDWVKRKWHQQLKFLYDKFNQDSFIYLFAIRLIPAFPYFLVNLILAIMPIKTFHFYWISQLGMLPGVAIYVYAGVELNHLLHTNQVLSPTLISAFSLLGLFSILAKKVIGFKKNDKNDSKP